MLIDFREKGREEERQRNTDVREQHQSVAFHKCFHWDGTLNPSMCPDQEMNLRPFGLQDDA